MEPHIKAFRKTLANKLFRAQAHLVFIRDNSADQLTNHVAIALDELNKSIQILEDFDGSWPPMKHPNEINDFNNQCDF